MIGLFKRHRRKFKKKSLPVLKDLARVLIIDDVLSDLLKPLEREGWKVRQVRDIDNLGNIQLRDSHILCVDILGVGKKMSFPNEGLGLVQAIREEYPGKRILLYSSVSSHDIFDKAIDLADRRLPKEGQPYPFIHAVQELAELAFDWDACVADIFVRFRDEIPDGLTQDDFNKRLRKCLNPDGTIDPEKVMKYLLVSVKAAKSIQGVMSLIS